MEDNMVTIPRRRRTVDVEIDAGGDEPVVFEMETLPANALAEFFEDRDVSYDGEGNITARPPLRALCEMFDQQVCGSNITWEDGEEFDPQNEEHLADISWEWKMIAASELMDYSNLGEKEAKN